MSSVPAFLVDDAASSGGVAPQKGSRGKGGKHRPPSTLLAGQDGLPAWVVVRVVGVGVGVGVTVSVVGRLSQLRSWTPSAGHRVPVAGVHCDPELFLQVTGLTGPYPVRLSLPEAARVFGRMQLAPELVPQLLGVCRRHPEAVNLLVAWHQAVVDANDD